MKKVCLILMTMFVFFVDVYAVKIEGELNIGSFDWASSFAKYVGWEGGQLYNIKGSIYLREFLKLGLNYDSWDSNLHSAGGYRSISNWKGIYSSIDTIFYPEQKISPYIGLGIGLYQGIFSDAYGYSQTLDWSTGINMTLGLKYEIKHNINMGIGYKYNIILETQRYPYWSINNIFIGISLKN